MGSSDNGDRPVGRKYVVACDGTWMNSDMGYDKSAFAPPTAQIPTNVTRIVRALQHRHTDGTPQIVFYQRGVGTDGDIEDAVVGGITGNDISEHIREAYAFLVNNFDPQTQDDLENETLPRDEIILLGFSRGAFTARAIASLISDVGLLTKIGMESFWGIFGDWMKQDMKGEESIWFNSTFGRKIPFTDPEYRNTLIKHGLTRWGMPIRAIGVWDTVGSLGIPLPFDAKNVKAYSFVNTKVAQHVQHAFHAIALDERRSLFSPTLWEQPDEPHKLHVLKQCWFPGVHSNIGGSYPDAGISNITLAWMVSQLEDTDGGILSFDPRYLDWVQDLNIEGYITNHEPIRPWGMGRLYDTAAPTSIRAAIEAVKLATRTPGRYCEIDTADGLPTKTRLTNTNEMIHLCVRARIANGGLGTEEDPDSSDMAKLFTFAKKALGAHPTVHAEATTYNSLALQNYTLARDPSMPSGFFWRGNDGLGSLPEDVLGRTELRLWKRSMATNPL